MAQSLFVVITLSLAGLLTVRQANNERYNQQRVVYEEMQLIASGAALKVIEYAASRSFDERTSPAMVQSQGLPGGAGQFSMASSFGESMNQDDEHGDHNGNANPCSLDSPIYTYGFCDDLDDLALGADEWKPVSSTLANGDVVDLEVNTQVEYVRRYNGNSTLDAAQRSEQKRLTVRVRVPQLGDQQDVLLVEMSRVLSYREERARRMAGM
ncbi:MAG: hypothetical protein AAF624_05545 [Bacteroidota bacterium]